MNLNSLKQLWSKPYFLLLVVVLIIFNFNCKWWIPELNNNPVANFNFERIEHTLQVRFYSEGSSDDGEIAGYKWKFGDGKDGEGYEVYHDYEEEGTYYVELTVTDDDDSSTTVTKPVRVYASNEPPAAVLSINSASNSEHINFIWEFDGSQSSDEDGYIDTYKFLIRRRPDNSIIENPDPGPQKKFSYIFKKSDLNNESEMMFIIMLTVKDDQGETGEAFKIITVIDQ